MQPVGHQLHSLAKLKLPTCLISLLIVAENKKVCRVSRGGRKSKIFVSSALKPASKRRSASSKTSVLSFERRGARL